jgi:PAS domain S-box-containing protein
MIKTSLAKKLLRSFLLVDLIAVVTMIVGLVALDSMQSTLSDVVETRWVTADMSMEYWIGSLTKVWSLRRKLEGRREGTEDVDRWAKTFVSNSLVELRRTDPDEREKVDRLAQLDELNDALATRVAQGFTEENRIRTEFARRMGEAEARLRACAGRAGGSPEGGRGTPGEWAAAPVMDAWVSVASLSAALASFELGERDRGGERMRSAAAAVADAAKRLRAAGRLSESDVAGIEAAHADLENLLGTFVTARERRLAALDEFDRNAFQFREEIRPMEDQNDQLMSDAVAEAARRAKTLRWILLGVTSASLVATVAIGLRTARSLATPIGELGHAARDLAKGKLDRRVPVVSTDEIGELAEAFNDMAGDLAKSNARLERSEAAYRNLFDDAVVGLYRADADGRVNLANRRLLDVLGCDAEPGVPHDVDLREHFRDEARWRELLSALEAQGEVRDFEAEMRRPDGRRLEVILSARRDAASGHIEGSLQDVTDRRVLEQQIVQKEKLSAIGQLAAGISHEMRNPLGIVSNALYDLRQIVNMDDPEVREDLAIATEELNRLNGIIGNLLEFSRESGSEPEPVDVRRIVERTLQLMAKSFASQNVEVVTDLGEPPLARFNANALKQVFINLVTNAAQAMPKGGRLAIRCRVVGDHLELEVEDTGIGIPSRDLPRIFNPFFTTKEAGKGTGLGLSIVHSTLRKYDGDVRVRSVEGKGTTFTVFLPLAEDDGSIGAPSNRPE